MKYQSDNPLHHEVNYWEIGGCSDLTIGLLKTHSELDWYWDTNPIPVSPLADDLTTVKASVLLFLTTTKSVDGVEGGGGGGGGGRDN